MCANLVSPRFELSLQAGPISGQGFLEQLTPLSVHGLGADGKLPRVQASQLEGDALNRGRLELDGAVTPQHESSARLDACDPRIGEQAGVVRLG